MTNMPTESARVFRQTPTVAPFVSVIIPVYNDAERLQSCLAALEQQTYFTNCYEVIVIDNGSDPSTNILAIAAQFKHVITTQELTPGSYAARNKGLSLAKGEIIAFTDADCVPSMDWLERGVSHLLANPNCGLVAGRINVFSHNPDHVNAIELYDQVVMGFPQHEFLEKRRAAATANVFTWRRVIDHVGAFRAEMKSHGDLEWGRRVFAAGYQQLYADDACVGHPARCSFDTVYTRTVRLAGGAYDLYIRQESSSFKRNKRFIKLLLDDLVIHLGLTLVKVLQDHSLQQRLDMKLKVLSLVVILKMVSAGEKIRLRLGGTTHRG